MKVSILLPVLPWPYSAALPFAGLVRHSHASRLWQGQGIVIDSYQAFAYLAAREVSVPMGSGVALTPLRSPLEAAIQINSLTTLTQQPFVAGFGPGSLSFQASTMGRPYDRPLQAMREYVTVVRALLAGELVEHYGEYFVVHTQLPPFGRQDVELGLGVLRPGMARLAGEVADVAITWLCPPSYIADVLLPLLRSGAEQAGRPVPRVVACVPAARDVPGRDLRAVLSRGSEGHLSGPHYRDMLARSGVVVDDDDRSATASRLLEAAAFLGGSPSDVLAGLERYRDAGVDEVVLNVTGVGMDGSKAALEELVELVTTVPQDWTT